METTGKGIEVLEFGPRRSRARSVLAVMTCAMLGAASYRLTHDILRVRAEGDAASVALSLDERRPPNERRDGIVLMTNEVLQRVEALRQIAAEGGDVGQQARDAIAQLLAAIR